MPVLSMATVLEAKPCLPTPQVLYGFFSEVVGTVLSQTAADRELLRDDDGDSGIRLVKGTPVSCDLCHEKPD